LFISSLDQQNKNVVDSTALRLFDDLRYDVGLLVVGCCSEA